MIPEYVKRRIQATAAAKTFGALVDRVRESGVVYQVESRGQVVAEIGPARPRFTLGGFRQLAAHGLRAPADLLAAVEAARADSRVTAAPPAEELSGRGGRREDARR
jgi:hypothetical protein